MSRRARRGVALAAMFLATVLVGTTAANSLRWVGAPFPGFLLLPNRVIDSTWRPGWPEAPSAALAARQVVAVDGTPVSSRAAIYEHVRRSASGTPIAYTLRATDGAVTTAVVDSRVFSVADYGLLSAVLLINGTAFLCIGLAVFWRAPRRAAGLGLLSVCLSVGVYLVTATNVDAPSWSRQLHVLAGYFVPAALIHLALVFPTDRIRNHRILALLATYLPFVAAAIARQVHPVAFDAPGFLHLLALPATALCAAPAVVGVLHGLRSTSPLIRRRAGVVALGAVAGVVVCTLLIAASGLLDGGLPLTAAGLGTFLLPLSFAYAIMTRDLFSIDDALRRATCYSIAIVIIAAGYFGALSLYGVMVADSASSTGPSAALALLGFLLLIAPVRTRVQQAVERRFLRQDYDAERALSQLNQALGSVRTHEEVLARAQPVFSQTLRPAWLELLEHQDDRWAGCAAGAGAEPIELQLTPSFTARLARGEILSRYEWDDGNGAPLPAVWQQLRADLLVPIRTGDSLIGLMLLGPKRAGQVYRAHDFAFLRGAANQVALALISAAAHSRLQKQIRSLHQLKADLDHQLSEREQAVHAADAERERSLGELRGAYQQLEEKQAMVLRAERLATLGHLSAGIAHEMNTPLSAVLNALKIVTDLGNEYARAIGDPEVLPEDHHEIADEIVKTAKSAADWASKAASFIRSVKTHGRDPGRGPSERFAVSVAVAETRTLLAHRLAAASCEIDFSEDAEAISVVGDPSRLSQVLANLVGNAIDAYEEKSVGGGRIEVHVSQVNGTVEVTVRDRAGGIPAHVVPHIFDELFTTKGRGRGTGLGLWIARNLVEEGFGGRLDVLTSPGLGSCFTASIPMEPAAPAEPEPEPSEASTSEASTPAAPAAATASAVNASAKGGAAAGSERPDGATLRRCA